MAPHIMIIWLWNTGHGLIAMGITLVLVALCGGPRRCGVAGSGIFTAGDALEAAAFGAAHEWAWMAGGIVVGVICGYICVSSALKPPRRAG